MSDVGQMPRDRELFEHDRIQAGSVVVHGAAGAVGSMVMQQPARGRHAHGDHTVHNNAANEPNN